MNNLPNQGDKLLFSTHKSSVDFINLCENYHNKAWTASVMRNLREWPRYTHRSCGILLLFFYTDSSQIMQTKTTQNHYCVMTLSIQSGIHWTRKPNWMSKTNSIHWSFESPRKFKNPFCGSSSYFTFVLMLLLMNFSE